MKEGSVELFCEACGRATFWSPPHAQAGAGTKRNAMAAGDKRRVRRAPMKLPVRIRIDRPDGQMMEDLTSTVNITRRGILIRSTQRYTRGLACRIALNYHDPVASQTEQAGRVVRVERGPADDNLVAIEFVDERP